MELWFQQGKRCVGTWSTHGNRLLRLQRDISCRNGRSQTTTPLYSHTAALRVCCQSWNCSEVRRDSCTQAKGLSPVKEKLALNNEVRCLGAESSDCSLSLILCLNPWSCKMPEKESSTQVEGKQQFLSLHCWVLVFLHPKLQWCISPGHNVISTKTGAALTFLY